MEDVPKKFSASPSAKAPPVDRAPQSKRVRFGGSNRSGTEVTDALIELSQLISSDLKDNIQLSRRIGKICKRLTQASNVEVALLEEDFLHLPQTQQAFSRLPLDESSIQGFVALNGTSTIITNPGTSSLYSKFPTKLRAFSAYTGEPVETLSVAVAPIIVR